MKCKNCGANVSGDDYFCVNCGKAIEKSSSKTFVITLIVIGLLTAIGIASILFFTHKADWNYEDDWDFGSELGLDSEKSLEPESDTVVSDGIKRANFKSEYEVKDGAVDLDEFAPVYDTGEGACWTAGTVYINERECKLDKRKVYVPEDVPDEPCLLRVEWAEDDTEYYCERYVVFVNAAAEDEWKSAFIEYLDYDSDIERQSGYMLIYVDDDDIPELVEVGKGESIGCRIINYGNGTANVTELWRIGFYYVERGNIVNNSNGNMGCYYDRIFTIKDGVMTKIAEGEQTENGFDDNGDLVYKYEWEGETVSEEEYYKKIEAIYDVDKAKLCPTDEEMNKLYSVDEMRDLIEAM